MDVKAFRLNNRSSRSKHSRRKCWWNARHGRNGRRHAGHDV